MARQMTTKVKGHPGIYRRRLQSGKIVYDCKVRIPDLQGRKIMKSATFPALAEADAFRADKVDAVRNHGLTLPPKVTFSQFADKHLATYRNNLSPTTRASLESRLKNHYLPALGNLFLSQITPDRINSLLQSKCHLEPKTLLNLYTDLHKLLKLAVGLGFLRSNPCDSVPKPRAARKEKPFLTPHQIQVAFDSLSIRHKPWFTAFASTGLRLSEILGLKWQDYDQAKGLLYVHRAVIRGQEKSTPKTQNSVKAVRVPATLRAALTYQFSQSLYRAPSDYIFCSIEGKSLDADDLRRRVLYPALQKTGIPMVETRVGRKKVLRPAQKGAFGFHILRHSMGSNLTMRTGNLKLAQMQLGHASISTTADIYAHLQRNVVDAEIDALDAEVFAGRAQVFDIVRYLPPPKGVAENQVV